MSTVQRYPTTTDEEREAAVEAASLAIQRGALVVLPTDTVYGLAADAFDKDSVQELLDTKGRGRDMPPPVLVSAATTLDALAVRAGLLLRAGGVLGVEHADVQGESVPAVLTATGRWADVRDHRDLAGRARFTTARLAR